MKKILLSILSVAACAIVSYSQITPSSGKTLSPTTGRWGSKNGFVSDTLYAEKIILNHNGLTSADSLYLIGITGVGDALFISPTGALYKSTGGGGSSPAAPLYGIQYNDGGVFAADSGFIFNPVANNFKALNGGLKGLVNSDEFGGRTIGIIDMNALLGNDSIIGIIAINRYENPGDDPNNVSLQIGNLNQGLFSEIRMFPSNIHIRSDTFNLFSNEDVNINLGLKQPSIRIDTSRIDLNLGNGRSNITISKGDGTPSSLPRFGASYYSPDLKYEHGFTAYGSNADHFSFDNVSKIDLTAFYTNINQATIFHYYDTTGYHINESNKWGAFQTISQDISFFTHCKGFGDFTDNNLILKLDTAKTSTFYGVVKGTEVVDPVDSTYYVQKKYVDVEMVSVDYGDMIAVGGRDVQVYTTGNGSGSAIIDLMPSIPIGGTVTVSDLASAASSNNIQIDAGVGNTIFRQGSSPGQDITLNTDGTSVTLRKMTSTHWMVICSN